VNSGALTELTETVDGMSDGGKRSWRNMFPMIVIEEGRTPTPKPEGRLKTARNRSGLAGVDLRTGIET
jgi:hypothetical protein